ncbi:MAG: carboxypeptidase-like regulatory domain-containing protein, partial [Rikenellaceae bacterium]|nr:carboxypeptidase-like regulatory domain-containing protein [Rikenellaceae bacterium]
MRTTLLLSMILFCRILCGQSLQGFVYDRELQEPIPGVAVYLDGTTGYAVTDDRGWYELSVSRRFQTPLVFQHLTYETVILHDPYSQLPDTLFLCEKTNWIDRITITPARFSRKEMLKSFRTIFLGESKAGKSCRITNEEDIVLFYDAQKEALIAAADRPLCIENRHLGYRVWFNLQTFQADFFQTSLRPIDVTRTVILGTTFFQDLVRANASRYIIRRWQAYDNSAAELFRALRENNLRESRFLVGLNPLQAHRNPLETVTGSAASKHAVSVTAYR